MDVLVALAVHYLLPLAAFSVTLMAKKGSFGTIREEGMFCLKACFDAGEAALNTKETISRADLSVAGVTSKEVELVPRSASRAGLVAIGDNRMLQKRFSCWE